MKRSWPFQVLRFIALVIIQVFILNNIQVSGYINPYLYIYFILLLPFETPGWILLITAFALGFSVDIFSGTIGMHTAASVFLAFLRPSVLRLFSSPREYEPGTLPSIYDLGFLWFIGYASLMILLHHLSYFYLEVFRLSEIANVIYRTFFSGIFTLLLIIITQYLFMPKKRSF